MTTLETDTAAALDRILESTQEKLTAKIIVSDHFKNESEKQRCDVILVNVRVIMTIWKMLWINLGGFVEKNIPPEWWKVYLNRMIEMPISKINLQNQNALRTAMEKVSEIQQLAISRLRAICFDESLKDELTKYLNLVIALHNTCTKEFNKTPIMSSMFSLPGRGSTLAIDA